VLAEQVDHLADIADDARMRQVVAGNPVADRAWHAAERDLTNHRRLLDETRERIAQLEAERDGLLERLFDLEDDT
jgi:hypothetical protein